MDSLLLVGSTDPKLKKLLTRLGYSLLESDLKTSVPELVRKNVVDLILVDSTIEADAAQMCEFFRKEPVSKQIPIVCLAGDKEQKLEIDKGKYNALDCIVAPYSIGGLVSKIATQLRLKKIAGGEKGVEATLAETNASLRDLTQRLQKELEEAQGIQKSLLPTSFPNDKRFAIAASYDPLEEVGGDWYFVQKEANGKISFYIADVTGHGISAAFIGSMTKLALTATSGLESPDKVLSRMNALMTPQLPQGRFVTMAGCFYDPTTGDISCARAGHPPALVLNRATNEVHQLQGEGFAVGFFEEAEYTMQTANLGVNDMMLLITDGISEAMNRSREAYGFARLADAMRKTTPEMTVTEIIQTILLDFETFRGGKLLNDDVTIIALKRTE